MEEKIKENKYKIVIIIILIIGFAVRLVGLNKVPNGLNVDEASSAYEAYAIGNYGIDRNGKSFPVYITAWESGQSPLYTYLCIPFIKAFGLNVITARIPMAIISCISLIFMYKMLKIMKNKKLAIIGLAFFAICPWHIMKSRWGLDCNLFPDIVLWGSYFIMLGIYKNTKNKSEENAEIKNIKDKEENEIKNKTDKENNSNRKRIKQLKAADENSSLKLKKSKSYNWIIYIGFVILGISSYSYSTSYFFLPIFVIPLLIYLVIKKELKWYEALICLLLVGVVSFPIILYVLINTFNLNEIKLFGIITIPKLPSNRMKLLSSVFADNPIKGSLINFKKSIKMLVLQNDKLTWNAIKGYGTIYIFSIFFTAIGIIENFKITNNKGKKIIEKKENYIGENNSNLQKSKNDKIIKDEKELNDNYNSGKVILKNIMNIWFIASVLLLFVCEPNINRINIIFIPIIYYTICGIYKVVNISNIILIIISIIYTICFCLFMNKYVHTNFANYSVFQDGLDEVYEYIAEISKSNASDNELNKSENIYIEYFYKEPFIYTLFYTKEDPNVFYKTAKRRSETGSFENIISYGKYKYYLPDEIKPEENTIYVLENKGQVNTYNSNEWKVKEFEKYIVLSAERKNDDKK